MKIYFYSLIFFLGFLSSQTCGLSADSPTAAKSKVNASAVTAAANSYLSRLRVKLRANWLCPDGKNNVTITGALNSDGSLDNINVNSVPNNSLASEAATEALTKTQPLEALPEVIGKQATLTLVFDSNYDPHGAGGGNISTKLVPIAPAQNQ